MEGNTEYIKRDLERKILHMSRAFKAITVVGAVICMSGSVIPFDENNFVIPSNII